MSKRTDDQLPQISRPVLAGFQWFVARYLAKHFHTLAVHRQALTSRVSANVSVSVSSDVSSDGNADVSPDGSADAKPMGPADSIVLYANHASWWDPLAAIFIAQRLFSDWAMYAPIDAVALRRYPMFGRMGFFGVDQQSPRGAANFLLMANRILSRPATSLWITPEGRFADVRDTTADLMPGLAHLAWKLSRRQHAPPSRVKNSIDGQRDGDSDLGCAHDDGDEEQNGRRVWFIPLAVEYTFWEERQPELLMRFGQPLAVTGMQTHSKQQWDRLLTERLRTAQAELAKLSTTRDATQFEVLLGGSSGTFFVYDWWRQLCGLVHRQHVSLQHGQKFDQR